MRDARRADSSECDCVSKVVGRNVGLSLRFSGFMRLLCIIQLVGGAVNYGCGRMVF